MDPLKDLLFVDSEVRRALETERPVVALESTDLSYGMPYPQNVEATLAACNTVREAGAVPALIAVIGGRLRVGITIQEIEYLAKKGPALAKASKRDLPVLAARGMDGVTTVAATMVLAMLAGIRVFATAGIGGVQRGDAADISADLDELARTGCLVVTSGVKSALDIPATLEYLETRGVPVLGYQTDEFPAFYVRASGCPVKYRASTPREVAEVFNIKTRLGFCAGLLVANPAPRDVALEAGLVQASIDAALAEAQHGGVPAKGLSAFLSERLDVITGGKTIEANMRILYENARLAAEIAQEL